MPTAKAALPLYMQTAEMLIRDIASGRLVDGERLPPERDMAAELGVAVGTLRKALDDLVHKGLLARVQGSGNYVRHNPDAAGVYAFFRLERLDGGGLPTAEVLGVKKQTKPKDLPAFGTSDKAHRIRRVRSLSGEAVALEEIWLDGSWAERIGRNALSESLYYFYRQTLGLIIAQVEDRVGLATLPDWPDSETEEIGCENGTPVGFVERWSRTSDGDVAEFSRTWFNPGRARYVARIR